MSHSYRSALPQEKGKALEDLPSPDCFRTMEGCVEDYCPGTSLSVSFPVKESYLNPAKTMQGGFITAAFDNVFGPFCLLESGTPATTTIDINTTYHRPIMPGDTLRVTAFLKSKGKTKIHMIADAYNSEGKLVASATSTYIYLNGGRAADK